MPMLSWIGIMVMVFAALLPADPLRMTVAALIAVSMNPVGMLIARARGTWPFESWLTAWSMHYPDFLVVGVSIVVSRVVQGMGQQIARAREMGSYELGERIGRGGMGEVYRAKHRMLARPAAIKLIRPAAGANGYGGASLEAVRRFEREAQVIAQLRSPHTVELFDFGTAADGAFYYVMELLDGLDADSLLRRFGPLPPERVIYLMKQICHSLSEAQSCGLVHRDIKPANIFVCHYGEEYDFVKVLDFGIVRAVRDEPDPDTIRTREDAVHGTPGFIAPEQAMGTGVDGRADIYATGCVAYWMLTGKTVFTADTVMGLILHHVQTPATPPSTRTDQPISPALDDLILSCLSKDPAERPQTAKELSLRFGELPGANDWTQDRAREWWEAQQLSESVHV
jgi:serine/threonine-protein kinase